jgi:N,N-dimethylformamidase
MHPLLGYVDRWSAKPGETIRLMVSSAGDAPFEARFARILCGDPNPRGPGYREIAMAHPLAGRHPGNDQRTHLGSWAAVPRLDLAGGAEGLVFAATIWPTSPARGRQVIMSWRGDCGTLLTLEIDSDGVVATLGAGGAVHRIATGRAVLERAWYDVWLAVDPGTGRLAVGQRPREPHPLRDDEGTAETTIGAAPRLGAGRLVFAACAAEDAAGKPSLHWNGKLERPCFWRGVRREGPLAAQRLPLGEQLSPDALACWDFSRGIDTLTISDVGPQAAHGRVENMPTRAMTGSNWSGREHRWTHAPAEWGAIHFHDDDLGDVGWTPSLEITIPGDWPSGIYAVHLRSANGVDNVPFVVRPGAASPKQKVAILLPTVTYHVYGNYVRPGWGRNNRARAIEWGAITHTPDENPELGLSPYNFHSDGSGVSMASMFRPMIDKRVNHFEMMDPAEYGSGCYWVNVDSYVVDWLTRKGIGHDVITDHDLHAEGVELLKDYSLVITCQHPEYYTSEMLDGLEGFLARGGRLMYLGGNGFYWKTVFHKEAPWALEVRRAENGIRTWATEVGESYHGFDGSYGGLWRKNGRSAYRLVGNGFSSQGIYVGFPYTVNEAIGDPRVAFMRRGLERELHAGMTIGERGYMGGGAAGHELDRADVLLGTPYHALVVATAVVDHPQFKPVNEDRLGHQWPGPVEKLIRADMVFFETPAGGAVFSVGSMNFVGALPIDGYDNLLTRMMTNVVKRFIDPEPFG